MVIISNQRCLGKAYLDRIQLESPACCVPVIDDKIFLLLKPSGYLPYAPATQTIAWFEKSQRDIYGTSNAPPPRSFFSSWSTQKSGGPAQSSTPTPTAARPAVERKSGTSDHGDLTHSKTLILYHS